MDAPDPLEQNLRSWQPEIPPDPDLKRQVMQRIAWEEEAARVPWHRRRLRSPWSFGPILAAAAAACLLLVVGLEVGRRWAERNHQLAMAQSQDAYRLLIDPVSRVGTLAPENGIPAAAGRPNLVRMLAWMQERFDLDRDQFLALVALHETYQEEFDSLYRELSSVQVAYESFEARRAADEMVDFMALYDLLQRRRSLEDDAHAASTQLVQGVLALLDPAQGAAYLTILEQAARPTHAS